MKKIIFCLVFVIAATVSFARQVVLSEELAKYLPLTGGILTGNFGAESITLGSRNPDYPVGKNSLTIGENKVAGDGSVNISSEVDEKTSSLISFIPISRLVDKYEYNNILYEYYIDIESIYTPILTALDNNQIVYCHGYQGGSKNTNYFITDYVKAYNENKLYFNVNTNKAFSANFTPGTTTNSTTIAFVQNVLTNQYILNHGLNVGAYKNYSHAEGRRTIASGLYSHSEGDSSIAGSSGSHSEGLFTEALASNSHTEGYRSVTKGNYSHAEGSNTKTYDGYSHAEGSETSTYGVGSHAEGSGTSTYGTGSHAEGINTPRSLFIECTCIQNSPILTIRDNIYPDERPKILNVTVGDYIRFNVTGTTYYNIVKNIDIENYTIEIANPVSYTPGASAYSIRVLIYKNDGTFGPNSHSEGFYSSSVGDYSHADGMKSISKDFGTYTWNGGSFTNSYIDVLDGDEIDFSQYGYPIYCTLRNLISNRTGNWNTKHITIYFTYPNVLPIFSEGISTAGVGPWYSNYNDIDVTDIIFPEEYLSYPIRFEIDSETKITFQPKLYSKTYYSHGEGTYNINPKSGMDGFYIGEKPLSSLKWANQEVYIGISDDDLPGVKYNDGDEIQLQNENGSIQYFDAGNGGPASITLILPEITVQRRFGYYSLTLFVDESDDEFIRYNISSDNCYAPWFPVSQPWDSFDEGAVWKIKFESPPGTSEWYFLGAEKYPY